MLVTLVIFLVILSLWVFVHELGHFLAAKRIGVTVHEFAFGFRPRLVAWKRGETIYAINLLPFGGYVRLEGESEDSKKAGSLMSKSPRQRVFVLVAGIVMNLLLAWILLTLAYGLGSYPISTSFGDHAGVSNSSSVLVLQTEANSPAAQAGLQQGDTFVSVNGQPVQNANSLVATMKQDAGQLVALTYRRNSVDTTITITPRANPPQGQGALGVSIGESSVVKASWARAPIVAIQEVGSEIKGIFTTLGSFIHDLFVHRQVSQNVIGIVGVGEAVGVVRRLGIAPLMQFTALVSTNLAVVNLLPLLPLDGGHILFTLIEAIRRRPVKDIYRQWTATAGLALILALFLIVTYEDVARLAIFDHLKNIF